MITESLMIDLGCTGWVWNWNRYSSELMAYMRERFEENANIFLPPDQWFEHAEKHFRKYWRSVGIVLPEEKYYCKDWLSTMKACDHKKLYRKKQKITKAKQSLMNIDRNGFLVEE